MGVDIQLHHSSQWQKLHTCPRIRIKKSCDSKKVVKSCERRTEIVSSVNEPNPVVVLDVTETNQTRYWGTSEDVQVKGQVRDGRRTNRRTRFNRRIGISTRRRRDKQTTTTPYPEHGRYKDFVCHRNECRGGQTGGEESGRVRPAPRKPIPRPCRYCGTFLEGRQDQRRHVQDVHKDILVRNREQARKTRQLTEEDDWIRIQVGASGIRRVKIGSRTNLVMNKINADEGTNESDKKTIP